jgi:glycosyltransferase involved in cell wall biosynthesis
MMISELARPSASKVVPLRVLCISHSAVHRSAGRLRYGPLLDRPELSIDLLTPARWLENGRWTDAEPPQSGDVRLHVMPVRWVNGGPASWHLHNYPGLRDLMLQVRPQVIHLWQEPWSLVTLQAVRLRNQLFPNSSIVLEVDQNILKRLPPPFEQIRRFVLKNTNYVLGRSADAIKVVEDAGYAGPSGLVGYGVDRSVFHPIEREAARTKLGFRNFTIGYVGRLIEEKGIDDIVQALTMAATPVMLAIMGEGPHRGALFSRASALGLSERVKFKPWGTLGEVATFMGAIDALALVTRTTKTVREQFGRVIIEAQACGTPVIGSDSGAIPDIVGDGGWIVPERNPAAIASLLDRLPRQTNETDATRVRALTRVAERFSYPAVANILADAWTSVRPKNS